MLEIPSKKHKNVTFVLAAEYGYVSHLLALTLGKTKRMVKVDSKQVSSSSSKIMLLEGFITQKAPTTLCVRKRRNRSTSAWTTRRKAS